MERTQIFKKKENDILTSDLLQTVFRKPMPIPKNRKLRGTRNFLYMANIKCLPYTYTQTEFMLCRIYISPNDDLNIHSQTLSGSKSRQIVNFTDSKFTVPTCGIDNTTYIRRMKSTAACNVYVCQRPIFSRHSCVCTYSLLFCLKQGSMTGATLQPYSLQCHN